MDAKHPLVADVMSVDPVVVKVDASLAEADVVLRSTYLTGIPVVDRNGTLVGVLSHAHLAEYRYARRVASIRSEPSQQAGVPSK
jgi:predicted transcriptional regulator